MQCACNVCRSKGGSAKVVESVVRSVDGKSLKLLRCRKFAGTVVGIYIELNCLKLPRPELAGNDGMCIESGTFYSGWACGLSR